MYLSQLYQSKPQAPRTPLRTPTTRYYLSRDNCIRIYILRKFRGSEGCTAPQSCATVPQSRDLLSDYPNICDISQMPWHLEMFEMSLASPDVVASALLAGCYLLARCQVT
ncbi:hypothetical protein BM1_04568 [Bipolaris maydis]|nr:hypothetical protein BM1_04568 [Bipolaris maydis]